MYELLKDVFRNLGMPSAGPLSQQAAADESLYQELLDQVSPDALFVHDHDGRFLGVNAKACRGVGYSRAELLGMNVKDLEVDFDLARAQARWIGIERGDTAVLDGRYRRKDGSVFPVEVRFGLLVTGGLRLYFATVQNITERARAEALVRENAAQLRNLFDTMAEGLVVHGWDGKVVDANPAAESILGLSRDQILGRSPMDPHWQAMREDGTHVPGEEHPAMVTLRTGRPLRNQLMRIGTQGKDVRWLSVNSQPLYRSGRSGQPDGVIATFIDITERQNAFEQIRHLSQRLETLGEHERRALSQKLHEGIAQDLFAARLALDALKPAARSSADADEAWNLLEAGLDQCIRTTRELANELRPAALAHLDVCAAITEHARRFHLLSGLDIKVSRKSPLPNLDEAQRLVFFRAAQEALTNVARHAHASTVHILLGADAESISMEIADDGCGIEEIAPIKPGSLGLLGIRERLRALGGEVRVSKNSPKGTTVSVLMPNSRGPAGANELR
jgi:PAS domain S-box-containing protein